MEDSSKVSSMVSGLENEEFDMLEAFGDDIPLSLSEVISIATNVLSSFGRDNEFLLSSSSQKEEDEEDDCGSLVDEMMNLEDLERSLSTELREVDLSNILFPREKGVHRPPGMGKSRPARRRRLIRALRDQAEQLTNDDQQKQKLLAMLNRNQIKSSPTAYPSPDTHVSSLQVALQNHPQPFTKTSDPPTTPSPTPSTSFRKQHTKGQVHHHSYPTPRHQTPRNQTFHTPRHPQDNSFQTPNTFPNYRKEDRFPQHYATTWSSPDSKKQPRWKPQSERKANFNNQTFQLHSPYWESPPGEGKGRRARARRAKERKEQVG